MAVFFNEPLEYDGLRDECQLLLEAILVPLCEG